MVYLHDYTKRSDGLVGKVDDNPHTGDGVFGHFFLTRLFNGPIAHQVDDRWRLGRRPGHQQEPQERRGTDPAHRRSHPSILGRPYHS